MFSLYLQPFVQLYTLLMPHFFLSPSHSFFPLLYSSSSISLLVVCGAALPLSGVVHARRADGARDEVSGAWGHEVCHCRRDVHPLVCHQVI